MASNDAATQIVSLADRISPDGRNGDGHALTGSSISVDFTSELRWFTDGQLPSAVVAWFAPPDVDYLTEHRCDIYRLDAGSDVGVKRRFGSKLELKVRTRDPEIVVLNHGFVGRLERWNRWSPADGLVGQVNDATWIDTHKTIIKRRFTAWGEPVDLTHANRAMTGAGCDLEIAAIEVDGRHAWTLAFAAFGPRDDHLDLIHAAWRTQCHDQRWPMQSSLVADHSSGYPEWLALA